jgi:hypothetical protein
MPAFQRTLVLTALVLTACPEDEGPQAPSFSITSPAAGALVTEGYGVALEGVVDDADDVPEGLRVSWSVDGLPVCADLVPLPDGRSTCTWVAQLGGGAIEAVVTDPGGLTGSASLEITVAEANVAPTCSFDEPADGTSLDEADPVALRATVLDDDDDSVVVVFVSSLDKELASIQGIGSVEVLVGPLSVGEHTLTMTATDPHGSSCSDERSVEVVDTVEDTAPPPDTDAPDPDTGVPSTEP